MRPQIAYDRHHWTVLGDLRDPARPHLTNLDAQQAVADRLTTRRSKLPVQFESTEQMLMLTVDTQLQAHQLARHVEAAPTPAATQTRLEAA